VARSFPQSVRLKKIQKQSAAAKKLDGGMRLGACAQRLKAHRGLGAHTGFGAWA
jgi:hypothetical protein